MKIAIVSDAIYPYHMGGKEVRIYELAKRLARVPGFDVHIYTMKWWKDAAKTRVENGVTLHAISRLHPLYVGERRSIKQGVFFGVSCLRLLFEQFDVVDVDHMPYFPLFFTKLASVLKRKPMIGTFHEVWGLKYWRNYLGTPGILAYLLEKLTVLMPSKFVAASSLTADRLQGDMKVSKDLVVIPNGIDLAALEALTPARDKSDIIYVGRLLEHKKIDLLLQAVALIKVGRPDVKCFIVGGGPERENLERLSYELGLQDNVKFLGVIPEHDDVYSLMKASKVFVSPSVREGFGITLIEANGCGLPVVTVDAPGNAGRHLVNEANGRVAHVDAADIARATSELLGNPPQRSAMVSAARPYDWNRAAQSLREVYES